MAENNWAPHSVREVPFWRNDMSPEEYEVERTYYYQNYYTTVRTGEYLPLWKQKTATQK